MKLDWLSFAVFALLSARGLAVEQAAARPNIVFIISDDQAWSDYGFMGHPQVATPRLDRLAAESLTFQRGYTPVPLCRPSLTSIVTGLYPHQHSVTGNDPALPDKGSNAMAGRGNPKYDRYYETIINNFARHPNLMRDLTARGYVSLQTGKWWEGDPVKTAGFTHAMTAGTGKGDRHGGEGLAIGREGLQPITKFIEAAGGKPFVVWYAPMLPHTPHTPPDELLQNISSSRQANRLRATGRAWNGSTAPAANCLIISSRKGCAKIPSLFMPATTGGFKGPIRPTCSRRARNSHPTKAACARRS
jgi:hypothetical protein